MRFLDELVEAQQARLLEVARELLPQATMDDLLQPNDFPELEQSPHFRYEEGVLAGLLTARMATLALLANEKEVGVETLREIT